MEGTVLAWRSIQEWKFTKPVFIGDTVRVDIAVLETKAMPRLGGGLVQLDLRVLNQQGEVVQRGRWGILVQSRPE
jgi:acyl dehydratase